MKNSAAIGRPTNRCQLWSRLIVVLIAVMLLSLLVFRDLLESNSVLFMTDNNLGLNAELKAALPAAMLSGSWGGGPLLGLMGMMPICLKNLLMWGLTLMGYNNWFHAVSLSLASFGFALFCFRRGCGVFSVLIGLMTAFWLGSDLTLTYSGHDGKYGVFAFTGLSLWLIEMAANRRGMAWAILAGGAVGMMFVEQQDVALFMGLFLGAYAVYAILRENAAWRALVFPLMLMALTVLLVGGPNLLSGYMTQVKGVVSMSDENPQKKWEYCTQWSLPPEDMLEFIAPGYRGIRSGEPEGPYWGRQGRSAEWEKTNRGFPNFKLESMYVGMLPIGLAIMAVFMVFVGGKIHDGGRRTEDGRNRVDGRGQRTEDRSEKVDRFEDGHVWSGRRRDIIFWGFATLVALLLSLGKYFPLYSLFYQIPGMSSIRNPLKFMPVFQIGLGILAAFGADALIKGLPEGMVKAGRRLGVGLLIVAGLLLVWTGVLANSKASLINDFVTEGWAGAAPVMVNHMVGGIFHASVMTLIIGGAVMAFVIWRQKKPVFRYVTMGALVLVMVVDVMLLAKDYIKVVKFEEVAGENVVTLFLKENLNQQRAYMLSQDGFYNNWLMVLFLFHHIETFNVSQMPRMPEDYSKWLKTVGRDPIRMWQLSAIGYVLAPDQAWQQIQKEPRFSAHFETVKGYNVYASGAGTAVVETPQDKPAGHRILRFKDGLPRFKLFYNWDIVSDDVVGEKLVDRSFDPHFKVLVAPDGAGSLPVSTPSTNVSHRTLESRLSATDAKVTAEVASPAVLMFVNKHSADWQVAVDGKAAPLLRCNALCLGVYLEPGKHEVRFYLRNKWDMFLVEVAGLLVCLVALLSLLFRAKPDARIPGIGNVH